MLLRIVVEGCSYSDVDYGEQLAIHIQSRSFSSDRYQRKLTKAYQLLNNITETALIRFTYTTLDINTELRYCFLPKGKGEFPILLDIDYKTGSQTNDYKAIATKNNLNEVELEVQKLMDLEADIRQEKLFLIEREGKRSFLYHGISKHIISYGSMCLGIFFILTYITMFQIRKIILQKKLI